MRKDDNIRKLLFELIQVVLGNRDRLSWVPTVEEWLAIYDEAERQAITGVMVAGLERLPKEQRPHQELLLQWIGISEQIRQGNLSLTKHCKQLQRKVCDLGYKSSILKGQGVALNYDEPLRDLRQSGDIDIFVDCGREKALLKVRGERLEVRDERLEVRDSYECKESVGAIKEFGMEKFARGVMWVMQEALGMPREWMLWEPDEKEGKYILDEVMAGGNFGHYDQRLTHGGGKWNTVKQVCRHNWHLMSHYFADVVWAPIWFVWHKCWKLRIQMSLN